MPPCSAILLRFCTFYEDHNLLEYDAVNFSTCIGRLHENEVVDAYKALVSISQITCIRSQISWRSYSDDIYKFHCLSLMYTYGYTVYIYIYIYMNVLCQRLVITSNYLGQPVINSQCGEKLLLHSILIFLSSCVITL